MPECGRQDRWVAVCRADRVLDDAGVCVHVDGVQIAVFRVGESWCAVQNRCPHWNEMVLARAMTGEVGGEPKIACPMHKRTFSLRSGRCLSGEVACLRTFAARVVGGQVEIEPPDAEFAAAERRFVAEEPRAVDRRAEARA